MTQKKRVVVPSPPHWSRFEPDDAYAVKALAAGTANEAQQKRAFNWILKASKLRDDTFVSGQPDTSAYLAGMRAVGLQIVAALDWKPKET